MTDDWQFQHTNVNLFFVDNWAIGKQKWINTTIDAVRSSPHPTALN